MVIFHLRKKNVKELFSFCKVFLIPGVSIVIYAIFDLIAKIYYLYHKFLVAWFYRIRKKFDTLINFEHQNQAFSFSLDAFHMIAIHFQC
jgi:hypothetical protein